jgi:sensor histidine kinase regulating citrate/malate metabolism
MIKNNLAPNDIKHLRSWLIGVLNNGAAKVTFIKKDGTERAINCTLKEDLTVRQEKKTDTVKTVNEEVLPVFDIDKQEWRSFRLDSVRQINFTLSGEVPGDET